jgi:hypothetical protein
MESKGGDEGRKHDEAGDAEGEEEAWEIHTDKKSNAGHNHGEQRKCPLRMKCAGLER